ncbi:ABC-2 transporter permease [candidate division KSB1 bacterium]|nr:ABC-2 transporter permease [candidate division KSB1 bacterium]
MIVNLIIKDVKAFGKSLLIITVLSLVVISLFSFLNEHSWFVYIVMATGQISFIIGYYLTSDKIRQGEPLICSLPVSRTTIIRGKYLAASLIAIFGMMLWFLYAWLLHLIFKNTPDDLYLFTRPLIIFFIIFYFACFISAFIPLVTIMDKIWSLTNLSILFATIFIIAFSFFYETSDRLRTDFNIEAFAFVILLTVIMIILTWFSIQISNRLFQRREL